MIVEEHIQCGQEGVEVAFHKMIIGALRLLPGPRHAEITSDSII